VAASVTALAAVIALVQPGRRRVIWGMAAAVFAALMALSRAYLGAHWLSDAIAGLRLGTSCALAAAAAAGRAQRRWRRMGPGEIAAALSSAGLHVGPVSPAGVPAKGSRPFVTVAGDGRRLFVKALGAGHRHADLLYRAYRAVRLKQVGDARPAGSLRQAAEHQALVMILAERAGVPVPALHTVLTPPGAALLVMDLVEGSSLDVLPADQITDDLLRRLWAAVRTLHRARLAHRSLRAANIMVDRCGRPWIVDFSFAERSASQRQQDLDVAELLASLAVLVGAGRAVASAAAVIGTARLTPAVPLMQPLALSAATRRAVAGHQGLLAQLRSAAAGGRPAGDLARIQRVRPRTLLAIAAAAAAFYVLLPRLAQASGSWRAILAADWAWLPVVIAASALTYVAGALALAGCVPGRLRFWPTLAAQAASSFINRISPANVGGMALNVRYLQKSGIEPTAGVAAVGVNALAGAIVHLALIAIFFTLASHRLARAFALPSGGKLLLILAVAAAVTGLILATRPGRRFAVGKIVPALASSAASLRQAGRRPAKISLLIGGSALVTLGYIGGLAASVQAFRGTPGVAEVGAVYLGASAIAAASPTPGGLGAIEAALIAGLTGIGVKPGVAIPAVLTYRLATYWLPVAPGWAALHLLQRRDLL
jgi:undecaprenyl-diphosphatase